MKASDSFFLCVAFGWLFTRILDANVYLVENDLFIAPAANGRSRAKSTMFASGTNLPIDHQRLCSNVTKPKRSFADRVTLHDCQGRQHRKTRSRSISHFRMILVRSTFNRGVIHATGIPRQLSSHLRTRYLNI
jgi:hypothetical protein